MINTALNRYNTTTIEQFKAWNYLGDLDLSTLNEDEKKELLELCRKKANFTAAAVELEKLGQSPAEYDKHADEAWNTLEQKVKALQEKVTATSSKSLKM